VLFYNVIKDPHWYDVQGSDTTMMPIAQLPVTKSYFQFNWLRNLVAVIRKQKWKQVLCAIWKQNILVAATLLVDENPLI